MRHNKHEVYKNPYTGVKVSFSTEETMKPIVKTSHVFMLKARKSIPLIKDRGMTHEGVHLLVLNSKYQCVNIAGDRLKGICCGKKKKDSRYCQEHMDMNYMPERPNTNSYYFKRQNYRTR